MKSRYELPFATTYVPDWTYVEATRELFQNALDNEIMNPDNEMLFNYDEDNTLLTICNRTSILELDSLLMGSTTKADNSETIGQHGEGYKIAFLVLLREGKTIKVFNYGKREIWEAKLVKSRRYNGNLVPVITVNKEAIWRKVPSHDLVIEIGNVTSEEYAGIVKHNLNLQSDVQCKNITNYGRLLTDPKERGNIYVKGLYVCNNLNLSYGYDFKPSLLRLDRDRRMVESFNLCWQTSEMLKKAFYETTDMQEEILNMIESNAFDTRYIESVYVSNTAGVSMDIAESIASRFLVRHGDKAVPVKSNEELSNITCSGLRPVIVNDTVAKFLGMAVETKIAFPEKARRLSEDMVELLEKIEHKLDDSEVELFNSIIDRVKQIE